LVFTSSGATKDADVTCTVERRTGKYRTSALAESATEWGVRQTARVIARTFEIESQAVSRREDETFERRDRGFPAA
jgi:hypothetical protein